MKFNVQNEYDQLKSVFTLSKNGGKIPSFADVPEYVAKFMDGKKKLENLFTKYDIEVKNFDIPIGQRTGGFCRDPYIVIGDTLYMTQVPQGYYSQEKAGMSAFLDRFQRSKIQVIPDKFNIDGGDIIMHNDTIYVGQGGMRMGEHGLEFIKKEFGNMYNIVPIEMAKDGQGDSVLHLDCVFNPISENEAIAYTDGISDTSAVQLPHCFASMIKVTKYTRQVFVVQHSGMYGSTG